MNDAGKAACLALVLRESDAKTARDWMVGHGVTALRSAHEAQDLTTELVNRSRVVAMCLELPDDMVIRLRCFPNVWGLKA